MPQDRPSSSEDSLMGVTRKFEPNLKVTVTLERDVFTKVAGNIEIDIGASLNIALESVTEAEIEKEIIRLSSFLSRRLQKELDKEAKKQIEVYKMNPPIEKPARTSDSKEVYELEKKLNKATL